MSKSAFEREFTRLNSQQKEAVETIEGPVMILAGPGTGKTQVLTMRIAEILRKTQLDARNILALTFTDSAAKNMTERLTGLIGPDAYQATITTFHSFANEILTTFSYIFNFDLSLGNLTDLEKHQIIEALVVDNHRLKHLRPTRSPHHHVKDIASKIASCKREAIEPKEVVRLGQEEYSPDSLAKPTKAKSAAQQKKLEVIKEFAELYQAYEDYLHQNGLHDYEDMILKAIWALQNDPDVKAYYQERYQYVLVDEYQDTNNSQNKLIETLVDFFDRPNIFVVGDDKQSIYRFQGASVANMLHFAKKYPRLKVIALKDNYRNGPKLLEAASDLIARNSTQLTKYFPKLSADIVAVKKSSEPVPLLVFENYLEQFGWLIEELTRQNNSGVPWEEMAVLFQTNNEADEFEELAEKFGLPVISANGLNVFSSPVARNFLMILRAVLNPENASVSLPALSLVELGVDFSDLSSIAKMLQRGTSVKAAIDKYDSSSLNTAWDKLIGLGRASQTLRAHQLLEEVVSSSECFNLDDLEHLGVLKALLDEARALERKRGPNLTLTELIEHFQSYLTHESTLKVRDVLGAPSGFTVSTVHKAKGKEFEVVFLPNLDDFHWRSRQNRSSIFLPSAIVGVETDQVDDGLAELRRLFYVAMTRSKNKLFLSYSKRQGDGRDTLPCRFLTEIDSHLAHHAKTKLKPEKLKQLSAKSVLPLAKPVITERYLSQIRETIRNQPFSYTHYRAYKECPRQYLLRHVFKFPTPSSPAMIYGQAIHKALEVLMKRFRFTKTLPGKDFLLETFRTSITGKLSKPDEAAFVGLGERVLAQYYESKKDSWQIPVGVEYSFSSHRVTLDDVWLTGKYDRIDPIDPVAGTVRVVDYKASRSPASRRQIEGPDDSEGTIKEQMVFYALLASKDRFIPYRVSEFVIAAIDDEAKFPETAINIDTKEVQAIESKIKQTHAAILLDKEFPHTGSAFVNGCELCELKL